MSSRSGKARGDTRRVHGPGNAGGSGPLFHKILPFPDNSAVVVEYEQNYNGVGTPPIREVKVAISDKILCLPEDGLFGSGAVEIELTRRLKKVD